MKTAIIITTLVSMLYSFFGEEAKTASVERSHVSLSQ